MPRELQTPPDRAPDGVHLWLVLWKAYDAVRAYALHNIESLKLGLSDFGILEVLLHKGSQPVGQIGARVGLTSGAMTSALDRLENAGGAKKKIISFVPATGAGTKTATFADNWQSEHGTTTRSAEGKFTLRVPGEKVVAVSQEILSTGPVADITIEDVPLEDVIAELFTSQ